MLGDFVFADFTDDFDVGHPYYWGADADPPLAAVGTEADPVLADDTPGPYSEPVYDPAYYDTDQTVWAVSASPPAVSFSVVADPPPTDDTEGGYYSLFYDPSFYDTTFVSWTVID